MTGEEGCGSEIRDLLHQLGAAADHLGFFYIACAVSLCAEQPDRLLLVTKRLYPEVARQYRTNWRAVERDIRTVSRIIWRENRPLLERLAHRQLERPPRNTQLLAILSASLEAKHCCGSEGPPPPSCPGGRDIR